MDGFEIKRKALFASLDVAGNELKGTILDQSSTESHTVNLLKRSAPCEEISSDRTLTKLRGKESIFKKPELPISKCLKPRVAPDYQVNPHKWKKYSLADVDISENTNTLAHEMFFRSLMDKQNDSEECDEEGDDKIVFKKIGKTNRRIRNCDEVEDHEVDKPKLKGSKLVMPEYVIGKKSEKAKAKKKNATAKPEVGKQLMLSHLQEDEEE